MKNNQMLLNSIISAGLLISLSSCKGRKKDVAPEATPVQMELANSTNSKVVKSEDNQYSVLPPDIQVENQLVQSVTTASLCSNIKSLEKISVEAKNQLQKTIDQMSSQVEKDFSYEDDQALLSLQQDAMAQENDLEVLKSEKYSEIKVPFLKSNWISNLLKLKDENKDFEVSFKSPDVVKVVLTSELETPVSGSLQVLSTLSALTSEMGYQTETKVKIESGDLQPLDNKTELVVDVNNFEACHILHPEIMNEDQNRKAQLHIEFQ